MILILWIGFSPDASATALSVGQKAPALVVTDINGHKFDLAALHGKTVVITLCASWCPPCLAEIPTLNDFYSKYHAKNVEMLALSLDRAHDRDAMKKIAATMRYPAAMSSEASDNGFDETGSLPVTYVIDPNGNINFAFSEKPVTEKELITALSGH